MNFWKRLFGHSETKQQTALEIGNRTLSTKLNSVDRRRLRSPDRNEFRITLWHASQRGEIFVYASGDQSESAKPIGVIPRNLYRTVLPFIDREDEFVSYQGTFDRNSELLSLELRVTTKEAVEQERISNEKEAAQHDERLQGEHRKRLEKNYKLPKELEQSVNLGSSEILKGRRKIENLTLEFHDKEKYLDRHFSEARVLEDGKFICNISLDHRIIRTYYSDHPLQVKSTSIERDRSFGFTTTFLKLTIGLGEDSAS